MQLTITQISVVLKRARRRNIADEATKIQAVLRAEHLGQPAAVTVAHADWVRVLLARTTIFALGPALRLLLDAGDEEKQWRGTLAAPKGDRHPIGDVVLLRYAPLRSSVALEDDRHLGQGVAFRVLNRTP
ncbi:hypothetical protein [Streptomyces sp. NPDC046631]|uniref:hypothetical protein n=1 Tax=unclassified Streptomyces TaxID=2593676 RepID=UPI003401FDD4